MEFREAREIIGRLYSAAHSLACDDPDCPWAHLFNESSEPTDAGTSPREDALLLVLLAIVDNLGECLDLIHVVAARRDEASRPDHLAPSGTTSRSQGEGSTIISSHESLSEPPVPNLYHDQWAQSPAVSPPTYTAFSHSSSSDFPRAPVPSPTSGTTPPNTGTPTTDVHDGAKSGEQREQH